MKIKFDYLVFIGRFQPFHAGHYHVVKEALKMSSNVILVLGSHEASRSSRNPFTTPERIEIIRSCFSTHELERIHFVPQHDHPYNEEKWIAGVQTGVSTVTMRNWNSGPVNIGIIGYNKDHSSYYIKKFPRWEVIEVEPYKASGVKFTSRIINATEFRGFLFGDEFTEIEYYVNHHHAQCLDRICAPIFDKISAEMKHIQDYKSSWAVAPYPPIFVTTDAVVTQSGHVLLVQRRAQPGEGLWALPGGFLNQYETLVEGMLRELKEETKIDVPLPVLAGSIVKKNTYDHPHRSARGRTITEAYHIKLADMNKLPKIKGSDDAAKAKWVPLSEFVAMRSQMFEDHFAIVESLLGL